MQLSMRKVVTVSWKGLCSSKNWKRHASAVRAKGAAKTWENAAKDAVLKTAVPLAAAGIVVYAVPGLKETREALYLSWNYPYDLLYRGSEWETLWRGVVGATGLVASFKAVQAITMSTNAISSVGKTGLSAFTGVLTAMFCMEQSQLIVASALRVSKLISYTIDGLRADLIGRAPGELPVWERRDHITVVAVQKWKETNKSAQDTELSMTKSENEGDILLRKLETMAISELEGLMDAVKNMLSKEEAERVLEAADSRHKRLILVRMAELRRDESILKAQGSSAFAKSKSILTSSSSALLDARKHYEAKLDAIETEKKEIKEQCLRIHGEKLTSIWNAQVNMSVDELSNLRIQQYNLAQQLNDVGSSDSLLIKQELRRMDERKAILKRDSKEVFGVNISNRAESVTPWRTLAHR